MTTNPDRDPIDEEIERMLAVNPGLLEDLQEYDRRAQWSADLGEFPPPEDLRRRLRLPGRQPPSGPPRGRSVAPVVVTVLAAKTWADRCGSSLDLPRAPDPVIEAVASPPARPGDYPTLRGCA